MGHGLNRLSAVQVKAITGKGMHLDDGGLYFQMSAGVAKIFGFTLSSTTGLARWGAPASEVPTFGNDEEMAQELNARNWITASIAGKAASPGRDHRRISAKSSFLIGKGHIHPATIEAARWQNLRSDE